MFEEIDGTSDEVTSSVNLRWHLRPRNGTALSAKGALFREESLYEKKSRKVVLQYDELGW